MKILVATTNPGKLAELSALLDSRIEFLNFSAFPDISEVREDGKTFAANARKKALGYAKQTGLWTVADDSGLVIDALRGAPGIKSARFCGRKISDRSLLDHENMNKVLTLLRGVPAKKRTARFVCSMCLATPQRVLIETDGTLEGIITENQIGQNGFGYDPIFFVPELNKTVAELTAEEKNAMSHRGNAIGKFKPLLEKLLKSNYRSCP